MLELLCRTLDEFEPRCQDVVGVCWKIQDLCVKWQMTRPKIASRDAFGHVSRESLQRGVGNHDLGVFRAGNPPSQPPSLKGGLGIMVLKGGLGIMVLECFGLETRLPNPPLWSP